MVPIERLPVWAELAAPVPAGVQPTSTARLGENRIGHATRRGDEARSSPCRWRDGDPVGVDYVELAVGIELPAMVDGVLPVTRVSMADTLFGWTMLTVQDWPIEKLLQLTIVLRVD